MILKLVRPRDQICFHGQGEVETADPYTLANLACTSRLAHPCLICRVAGRHVPAWVSDRVKQIEGCFGEPGQGGGRRIGIDAKHVVDGAGCSNRYRMRVSVADDNYGAERDNQQSDEVELEEPIFSGLIWIRSKEMKG